LKPSKCCRESGRNSIPRHHASIARILIEILPSDFLHKLCTLKSGDCLYIRDGSRIFVFRTGYFSGVNNMMALFPATALVTISSPSIFYPPDFDDSSKIKEKVLVRCIIDFKYVQV
jgi:hypothetical protein